MSIKNEAERERQVDAGVINVGDSVKFTLLLPGGFYGTQTLDGEIIDKIGASCFTIKSPEGLFYHVQRDRISL